MGRSASISRDGLPKLNTISFWVGEPAEPSKIVAFAFGTDRDTLVCYGPAPHRTRDRHRAGSDAPRTLVFEAWTKAEHVAHWWDPSGTPLGVCEIDLRPAGAFRFVNTGPEGAKYPFAGFYREITPPARLVLSSTPRPVSNDESVTTLVFSEHDGKTRLTMTIKCASREERDALLRMRVDVGTTQTLDNLDEYLRAIG